MLAERGFFVPTHPRALVHTKLRLSGRMKGAILEKILRATMLLEDNNQMEGEPRNTGRLGCCHTLELPFELLKVF